MNLANNDLAALRQRNAALRLKIESILSGEPKAIRTAVDEIASLQTGSDNEQQMLELTNDNLKARADLLVSCGLAQATEFADLLWPRA